jgi:diaminopropionate ammonia-lyase
MVYEVFESAVLSHVGAIPRPGGAADRVITSQDFQQAIAEITSWEHYVPTPLLSLGELASDLSVTEVLYKDEGPRFGLGSFKALGGAYAALLVLQEQLSNSLRRPVSLPEIRSGALSGEAARITLVSATDGNHGRSLAWGCQRFGASCRIYIHAKVSEGRAAAMRSLGADVIRIGGDYDASVGLAREEAETNGWFVISDTSWPGYTKSPRDVMAGYGVMTYEIFELLPRAPTHVFLQGGVGGLAASVAAALRQRWRGEAPRVVVVEPELAACLFASAKAARPTTVAITDETIMAGLSCGEPSELAWQVLSEEVSDFLTIPDKIVGPTMRLLARPTRNDPAIEAGESSVAGLAALIAAARQKSLRSKLGLGSGSRVLVIGSEGITDREIYEAVMGETHDG